MNDLKLCLRLSVYSLTVFVVLIALGACASKASSEEPSYGGGGHTVWVRVDKPVMQPVIHYTSTDSHGVSHDRVIRRQEDANMLVMMEMTVINYLMHDVQATVNQDNIELVATDGTVFHPINTVTRTLHPDDGLDQEFTVPDFTPVWGAHTLSPGEQLEGYLVFESPPGTEFTEFHWQGPNKVTARFH